jgi:prepilin-type N-terminal cleavage/methylation domain-containing protein
LNPAARRGFTIIEMLVTLAVLGVLSAIAVPRYRTYKERARIAAMKSDLGQIRIAEEAHWAEQQRYTTDTTALDFNGTSDVHVALSSEDLVGGYTAQATHRLVPGIRCTTAMGREARGLEAGSIVCGADPSGAGTITPGHP